MHCSRIALRPSCRASNAFSVRNALASAFSTLGGAKQLEEQVVKTDTHESNTGSYTDYDSLSQQYGSRKDRGRLDTDFEQVQEPDALAARQVYVEEHMTDSSPIFRRRAITKARSTKAKAGRKAANGGLAVSHEQATIKKHPVYSRGDTLAHDVWKRHMQKIGEKANELSQNNKWRTMDPEALERIRADFDYQPLRLDIPESGKHDTSNPTPWALDASAIEGLGGMEILEQEITRFAAYIEPSAEEEVGRKTVLTETHVMIRQALHQYVPSGRVLKKGDVRTNVLGSQRTGLITPTSDIDIRLALDVTMENGEVNPRDVYGRALIPYMKRLTEVMNLRTNDVFMLTVLRVGQYPIINAQHRATNVDIQIVSAPPTSRQTRMTLQYLAEMPHLRTLYHVLRAALAQRGLVDVFNGGIGSYGLLMMIVAAIQRRSSSPPTTAAEQLRHFLNFYADFDTTRYGLTISPTPKTFLKHDYPVHNSPLKSYIDRAERRNDSVRAGQWAISQIRPLQPYLFCLQDPADPRNDLGRKTNAIKHLLTTFRSLRDTLQKDVEARDSKQRVPSGAMLDTLVGRCHEAWAERRRTVEEYGRMRGLKKSRVEAQGAGRSRRHKSSVLYVPTEEGDLAAVRPGRGARMKQGNGEEAELDGSAGAKEESSEHDAVPAREVQ